MKMWDHELWQLRDQMFEAAKAEAKGDLDLQRRLFGEKFLGMDKAIQAGFAMLMIQKVCGQDTLERLIRAVAEGRGAEITAILDDASARSRKDREVKPEH